MIIPIINHIIGTTIDDAWTQAVAVVVERGDVYQIESGSFEGQHRATLPLVIEMHSPSVRPLAPIMPVGTPAPTSEEAIDLYAMKYLLSGEKEPNEHYTYGEDLSWLIEEIIWYFKTYGFRNSCTHMVVGRPESNLFYNRTVDYDEVITVRDRATGRIIRQRKITNRWNKDPNEEVSSQCLRSIDVWVRRGKLHFWCYFRSNDLWGGFPENYGGIQLMKEYMAGELGVEDGPLIASSHDLHLYEYVWEVAINRLKKDPKELIAQMLARKE